MKPELNKNDKGTKHPGLLMVDELVKLNVDTAKDNENEQIPLLDETEVLEQVKGTRDNTKYPNHKHVVSMIPEVELSEELICKTITNRFDPEVLKSDEPVKMTTLSDQRTDIRIRLANSAISDSDFLDVAYATVNETMKAQIIEAIVVAAMNAEVPIPKAFFKEYAFSTNILAMAELDTPTMMEMFGYVIADDMPVESKYDKINTLIEAWLSRFSHGLQPDHVLELVTAMDKSLESFLTIFDENENTIADITTKLALQYVNYSMHLLMRLSETSFAPIKSTIVTESNIIANITEILRVLYLEELVESRYILARFIEFFNETEFDEVDDYFNLIDIYINIIVTHSGNSIKSISKMMRNGSSSNASDELNDQLKALNTFLVRLSSNRGNIFSNYRYRAFDNTTFVDANLSVFLLLGARVVHDDETKLAYIIFQ